MDILIIESKKIHLTIARLIAGNNITEKTIEHAHEIIELAQLN